MLSVLMLVLHFIYYFAERHYAECRYAERHYAECRRADTPKVATISWKYKTQKKVFKHERILFLTML